MERLYPYQHTSLEDLPEEVWKDIPGFEGYYQISTYGRIKSVARYIIRCTQRVGFWTKDKIMVPYLSAGHNRFLNQTTYRVAIKLYKDNKAYPISVSRYVYALFVEEFDLHNSEHIITYQDGDSQNTHYANLVLTTQKQVHKTCFAKKRRLAPNVSTARSITQYDLSGKKIATYPTVQTASTAVKHSSKRIYRAVKDHSKLAAGYYWRYQDLPDIDVRPYEKKRKRKKKHQLPPDMPTLDTNVSMQAAITETTHEISGTAASGAGV